jgi:hypothetical protein
MQKLTVIAIIVGLACTVGGCAGKQAAPPTAIAKVVQPKVGLTPSEKGKTMIVNQRSKFSVTIDPDTAKASVSNVKVWGDSGITCKPSSESQYIWYCTGSEPVREASVFVKVSGDFPDSDADYTVDVVAPTPTPEPPPPSVPSTNTPPEPTRAPSSVPATPTTAAKATTGPAPTSTATPVPPPPGVVTITSPADGATVPFKVPVEGKAPANLAEDVWVFAVIGGQYYPQSDYGNLPAGKSGDTWNVTVSVGESDTMNVGMTFTLMPATATKAASEQIGKDLVGWAAKGSWPGYPKRGLPAGVTLIESSKISVNRCKGFAACE